jgi:hypothetical protein
MVKAVCRFNEETVKTMSKKFRNRTLSGSILLGIVILAMGVSTIISAFSNDEFQKIIFIILGSMISLFSVYPVISTVFTHRKNYHETIKAMELDKGELTLEFIIKEKKIELKAIQNGEEQNDTILIRNLSYIKTHSDGVGIYLNENMYYIRNEEIVSGDRDMMLRIFANAGVEIKKR